jgi:hypothetical protein
MKVERHPEPLNAAKHAKDKTQIRVAIGGSYADRGRGSRNKALWPEPSRMTAAIFLNKKRSSQQLARRSTSSLGWNTSSRAGGRIRRAQSTLVQAGLKAPSLMSWFRNTKTWQGLASNCGLRAVLPRRGTHHLQSRRPAETKGCASQPRTARVAVALGAQSNHDKLARRDPIVVQKLSFFHCVSTTARALSDGRRDEFADGFVVGAYL